MKIQDIGDHSSACSELDPGNGNGGSQPISNGREDKQLEIVKRTIIRCCGGKEYTFLFIPKRDAFEKMREMIQWSMSRICSRLNPPEVTDSDDDFFGEDAMASFDMMIANIGASVQRKMFLKLRGKVAIRLTDGKPLVSYDLNFGQFQDLLRSFENPTALDAEKWRKYQEAMEERRIEKERRRELRFTATGGKQKKPTTEERKTPIFFKMKARVPMGK